MAVPDLGFGQSALQGFQLGRNIAGPNALGTFVKGLMERFNTLQTAQAKSGLELQSGLALEREKGRIQQEQLGQFLGGADGGIAGLQERLPVGVRVNLGPFSVERPAEVLERGTARISAESALRSLKTIEDLSLPSKGGGFGAVLARGIPGIPDAREFERAYRSLRLEIVTARGGKQLTPSEITLIESVFPNRIDAIDAITRGDESVIANKLNELRTVANRLIGVMSTGIPESRAAFETQQPVNDVETVKSRLRAKYGR